MVDKELVEAIRTVVREETDDIRQDVSGLKKDVSGLKEDVSGLKEDVSGLKEDVKYLKEKTHDLDERTLNMSIKMISMESKIKENSIIMETEFKRSINLISEGHQMLWDKLEKEKQERDEAFRIQSERLTIDYNNLRAKVEVLEQKAGIA